MSKGGDITSLESDIERSMETLKFLGSKDFRGRGIDIIDPRIHHEGEVTTDEAVALIYSWPSYLRTVYKRDHEDSFDFSLIRADNFKVEFNFDKNRYELKALNGGVIDEVFHGNLNDSKSGLDMLTLSQTMQPYYIVDPNRVFPLTQDQVEYFNTIANWSNLPQNM